MYAISGKEFLLWENRQLAKGGEKQSLLLLLDTANVISHAEHSLLRVNPELIFNLKIKLSYIEAIWDEHLLNSTPIPYLTGFTFWRDLKLKISKTVLIPRPETEIIVDIVTKIFQNKKKIFFAELGTGSGAISISLALKNPLWEGVATDIEKDVLELASKNFNNVCNQTNLSFCCGDWLHPLKNFKEKFDLILSNPPYIPEEIYNKLSKEVKNHEPKIALSGGKDGLDHIRKIINNAPNYLKDKGWLIIENHFDQGDKVKQLFLKQRFNSVKVLKDFSGIGRFTIGRYK